MCTHCMLLCGHRSFSTIVVRTFRSALTLKGIFVGEDLVLGLVLTLGLD